MIIAFDVETTGLNPDEGDRIVEIGMVEIDELNLQRTGRSLHHYLNPQREISEEAHNIHGLDDKFLSDKPLFVDIADELLKFIADNNLMAHNVNFDLSFLNAELSNAGKDIIKLSRFVDSLELAREKKPELNRFNLDALCRHYKIDISKRTKHGAMLDAELLTDVYFRLISGDGDLFADLEGNKSSLNGISSKDWQAAAKRPKPLMPLLTKKEERAHKEKILELGESSIWGSIY